MSVRSPIKYHGGKSYLATKIIKLLPSRDSWHLWREPFFGGGSVTLSLDPEGLSEAVNDIDRELMNFWNVISCPEKVAELRDILDTTPFSDELFFNANTHDCVTGLGFSESFRAANFFVRARQSRQGLGKDFATPTTRIRRGMNENVSAWLSAVDSLPEVHERMKRIEIRNMAAVEFIRKYDHERAVFYCDPPYLHTTRSTTGEYRFEMNENDHLELLHVLSSIKGRFLLSGYPSEMYRRYQDIYGWQSAVFPTDNKASGAKTKEVKLETVWMNY